MTEKEKRILRTIEKAITGAPKRNQDYLLGWAEGMAYTVCGNQPNTSMTVDSTRERA